MRIPMLYQGTAETELTLSTRQREEYIDTTTKGRDWWIDQGTAFLRESDVTTPMTLSIDWIIGDRNNDTPWAAFSFKTFHSITVTVDPR